MDVMAERRQQARTQRARRRAQAAHEAPPIEYWDDEPDIAGHVRHVLLPDTQATADIIAEATRDSECLGRLYALLNRDLSQDSTSWKADQLEALVDYWVEAGERIAEQELSD